MFWADITLTYPNPYQAEKKKDICKNIVRLISQHTYASVTTIILVLEVISQLKNMYTHTHTHTPRMTRFIISGPVN